MKMKVIKKKKRKEKEPEPKREVMVQRLPTRHNNAMRALIDLSGDLHEIEKILVQSMPGDWKYFFHLDDLENVLYKLKCNTVSIKEFRYWLKVLEKHFGKILFFLGSDIDRVIVKDSFRQFYDLQKKNKLTRNAVLAVFDRFPVQMDVMFDLNPLPKMEIAGKRKKKARVKSIVSSKNKTPGLT